MFGNILVLHLSLGFLASKMDTLMGLDSDFGIVLFQMKTKLKKRSSVKK